MLNEKGAWTAGALKSEPGLLEPSGFFMFFIVFYEVLRVQDITCCYLYCVLQGFVSLKHDVLLFFTMFCGVLGAQDVLPPRGGGVIWVQ